jgi:hypothetical protein
LAAWINVPTPAHPASVANPFNFTMNKNLIALTFLGLVAILLAGCETTTETTTTRTREESSMYAR